MYRLLAAKTEGMKGKVIDFAQALVRTPSLSLSEQLAADLVEKQMAQLGYDKVSSAT